MLHHVIKLIFIFYVTLKILLCSAVITIVNFFLSYGLSIVLRVVAISFLLTTLTLFQAPGTGHLIHDGLLFDNTVVALSPMHLLALNPKPLAPTVTIKL